MSSRLFSTVLVAGSVGVSAFGVAPRLGAQAGAPAPPAVPAAASGRSQTPDAALVTRARGIHDRVITLDTHNDISPANFQWSRNYTQDLGNQVNLPKMIKGGLDASFFIVYVGQDTGPEAFTQACYDRAYRSAIAKFDAVHRLTEQIAPNEIGLALTPDDVRRIAASGRKVAVIGIENGYPMGKDIRLLDQFYDYGARYFAPTHNGHNDLGDSAQPDKRRNEPPAEWNGLSNITGVQLITIKNS
jgi:microsomal dipeptidase-like Zn-dependent dipeptidase